MKKGLLYGCMTGIIAGIASMILNELIGAATGLSFKELNPVSIIIASVIANLIGAMIFMKWVRKTARPALNYLILTAMATILLTLMDSINPPAPKFWIIAYPIHLLVALVSILLIPRWLRDKTSTTPQAVSD